MTTFKGVIEVRVTRPSLSLSAIFSLRSPIYYGGISSDAIIFSYKTVILEVLRNSFSSVTLT